ncbi:MAG TPA: lipopolysaccharide biosynthesis protein [Rhodanobacteraceae bacterium]
MTGPIAKGTIRTTFVLGLYAAVQAGTLLLVARMLGPRQFGAFAGIASLAVLLGTLSTFGTHIVLLGEVARNPAQRARVLPYAIPVTLLCGAVLLAIYCGIALLALGRLGLGWGIVVSIGATELWLQPLFNLHVAEHHGLGRIARSQLLKTLPLALRLVTAAAIVIAHARNPLATYAFAYPAVSLAALAAAMRLSPAAWPGPRRWRLPARAELRNSTGYAALTMTAAGSGELDKTLAADLLPLSMAGVYSVAARVVTATTLPVNAMLSAALPRLFRDGSEQRQHGNRLLVQILAITFAYMIVVSAVLWAIAPVFDWLFGAKYGGLDHTIRWLCIAAPGLALRMAAGTILMAVGKPWVRVGFEVVGLAVLIAASIVLTRTLGALGMPLALAASEWVMAIIGIGLVFTRPAAVRPHAPAGRK